MSSSESQEPTGNRDTDGSEKDHNVDNTLLSSSGQSLDTNIQSTKQQSSSTGGSKKVHCEPFIPLDLSFSVNRPFASDTEKNKLAYQKSKEFQKIAEFFSKMAPGMSHSYEKPHCSSLSTPETMKDAFFDPAAESTEKAGNNSSREFFSKIAPGISHSYEKPHCSSLSTPETMKDAFFDQAAESTEKAGNNSSRARPVPFKEFTLSASDLPFTKQKLAESLSLEEACGFLPYIMKIKRADLRGMENELDQISVDLQIALRDAKNICILLENVPKDVPEDINAARVQAQKLMYLLSSSFRIFEKLDQWGGALKERIEVYSKQTGDYHSSVDVLLEYIMEKILEKLCRN